MTEASKTSSEASREEDEFGKSRGSADLDQINITSCESVCVDVDQSLEGFAGFSDSDGSELATDCTQSLRLNETRGSMESSPKVAVVDGFEETEGVTNKVVIASKNEDFADFSTCSSATITPDTNWVDFGPPVAASVRKVGENETEAPFDDGDFGDFASFSSAAPVSNNTDTLFSINYPSSVVQSSATVAPVVDGNNVSTDLEGVLTMIKLFEIGSDPGKDEDEIGGTDTLELDFAEFDAYDLEKTPRSQETRERILSLWASVRDVVEAKALEHEWETSVLNRNYLTSLEIEDNVPVKGLSKAPEVPEATSKPVEVSKAEHDPKKTVLRNSENMGEDLSAAAAKILFRLPRISFLRSKTISFPN